MIQFKKIIQKNFYSKKKRKTYIKNRIYIRGPRLFFWGLITWCFCQMSQRGDSFYCR